MSTIGTNLSCDLSTPKQNQHRIVIRNEITPHITDIIRSDSATKLLFSKPQVTRALLDQFIAVEGGCCEFLQFDVLEEENHFQLSVTGPAGSEDLVREFFADASKIENPLCGLGIAATQQKSLAQGSKFKSYFGRFFSLCVICCAAPYALVALGLMSVSAGAYFRRILEVSLVLSALMLVSYFSWRHFRSRQSG